MEEKSNMLVNLSLIMMERLSFPHSGMVLSGTRNSTGIFPTADELVPG